MLKISLVEGIKNIDKNKVLTYLTVLLFAFLFLLQGYTLSYYSLSQRRNDVSGNEIFSKYKVYSLGPTMVNYSTYIETNFMEELPKESIEFVEALENIDHLEYVMEDFSRMKILDFKGDPKIFAATDVDNLDVPQNLVVHAAFVSPNFHKVESYRVIKGRNFTDDDMVYVEGKPRPILLGYKYLGVYELGDIIRIPENTLVFGRFATEFEVIGFLEEDTTLVEKNGTMIYDMDNYIIFPKINMTWEEYNSRIDELKLGYNVFIVQNSNYDSILHEIKFYIEEDYEAEVLDDIQKALNEYSGIAKCVRLHDRGQASLKSSSRTEALTEFFAMITAVAMVLAVVTVLISIANRVSRNVKDYAIHITVGATRGNTVWFIVAEMAIILSCSMILGLIATKWMLHYINMPFYFWQFLGVYALTSVAVLILSAIVARISMRKYDICTLIK